MRPRELLIGAVFVAVGAWFIMLWAHAGQAMVSFDIYQYYLPNMLYAVARLRAGGAGLLWNAYQHCGEPFLGISSTGMLYPANLLFLVLDADQALRAVIVLNFAVAGVAMYAFLRELGSGRAAALCGALAFELGTATVDLSTWGPQMSGPWVWLPAAMLFCERLLRAPSFGGVVGLGIALALPLLPGFPQTVFFTYQLIALRVLFELVSRRRAVRWRGLAAIGIGLMLAPLLVAVQLFPAIEMTALGVRGAKLTIEEMRASGFLTWTSLMRVLAWRVDLYNPFVLVPCVVAGASWLRAATRRAAIFYTLAGALYFVLGFGPATPLFSVYHALPLGGLFRDPGRFMWMTSFCLAVLTGLGADAILTESPGAAWWRRWNPVAFTGAALVGVYFLSAIHLYPGEQVMSGAVVVGAVLAALGGRWRRVAVLLIVAAPAINLLAFRSPLLPPELAYFAHRLVSARRLLPDDQIYFKHAAIFDFLHETMSAQDRVFIINEHPGFALMPKSALLFQVPAVTNYEPQPSRRSAAYIVFMRAGIEMTDLNQYYMNLGGNFLPGFRKPLLDLTSARYIVIEAKVDNSAQVSPPLYPVTVSDDLGVVVYENRQALPRAFWVPRVDVVPNPQRLLRWLARGDGDPRQVALVEEPPPSGFSGTDAPADSGSVEFVVDEPERVVLRVRAAARGFVHLADQYYPGWQATVNGAPTPIMRANYLFRVVEVPAGESVVEFRYAPISVKLGAAVSLATLLTVAGAAVLRRRGRGPAAV